MSLKTAICTAAGGAGKLCGTLTPGETRTGLTANGFGYDLQRYKSYSDVPPEMARVLGEGVVAKPDGTYCAMLRAWRLNVVGAPNLVHGFVASRSAGGPWSADQEQVYSAQHHTVSA